MWPFPKRLVIPNGAMDAAPAGRDGKVVSGDRLENLVAGLGTSRDKRSYNRYHFSPQPTRDQVENMYDTSWLAGRIVSTVAHDMVRSGWELSWKDSGKQADAMRAVADAEAAYQFRDHVFEGLLWSRLFGGATTVSFLRGDTLNDLANPLAMDTIKKGSLLNFVTRDRWWIAPTGAIDDTPGPNFGLPVKYMLSDAGTSQSTIVHWTRLVRWNGRKLPRTSWFRNGMWDGTELQAPLDSVSDYDATKAGIAAMVWEANVDVMKAANLADNLSSAAGIEKTRARYAEGALMKSFNRIILIDKDNEDFAQKTIQFGGLKDVLMNFMIDVCGAADIPMTRLFGQSAAGISATGEFDMKNYHEHVSAKQVTSLKPQLMRLYEVLVRSTLGYWPDEFAIEFNELQEMTEKERSEIELNDAKRDQIYMQEGAVTEGPVARGLKERGVYNLTDADIKATEEMAKKLAVVQPVPPKGALPAGGAARPAPAAPPAKAA